MPIAAAAVSWDLVVPLIIKYGIPLAETIWRKWVSGNPPTEADWAELKALTSQTARDRMLKVLKECNIDVGSDIGKQFLALAE